MKNILLFGAGKSTTVLIDYLLAHSEVEKWELTVVDEDLNLAKSKASGHPNARVSAFDIKNDEERKQIIDKADIVISMLPPTLHLLVARDCIQCKKNMLTASYIDDAMRALQPEIEKNDLLFLYEMGLDPGIDHMSAAMFIAKIKAKGGVIKSFRSYCGGVLMPDSDNNPLHFKVTWNPINIVNAGKTGAAYKEENIINEVDYYELFEDCPTIDIAPYGQFAYYPNRDAISYMELYGVNHAETFVRNTLRHADFCLTWHYIVSVGLTNSEDEVFIKNYKNSTIKQWFTACLNNAKSEDFEDFLHRYVPKAQQDKIAAAFEYLGLFLEEQIPENINTSADILRHLMSTRLKMDQKDRDVVLMLHEIEYSIHGKMYVDKNILVVKGDDANNTAMAKTVGLPLAIVAKLILKGTINAKGLRIPVLKEIYDPVLYELALNRIKFVTKTRKL